MKKKIGDICYDDSPIGDDELIRPGDELFFHVDKDRHSTYDEIQDKIVTAKHISDTGAIEVYEYRGAHFYRRCLHHFEDTTNMEEKMNAINEVFANM